MEATVLSIHKLHSHPQTVAIAEIEYGGIIIRGLKLERHSGRYTLQEAGRKINSCWQQVYQLQSPSLRDKLLCAVLKAYYSLEHLSDYSGRKFVSER